MKEYNVAQRLLINLGGTAALAVALPDLAQPETEAPLKRRKVSYGAVLKAHFDRKRFEARARVQ